MKIKKIILIVAAFLIPTLALVMLKEPKIFADSAIFRCSDAQLSNGATCSEFEFWNCALKNPTELICQPNSELVRSPFTTWTYQTYLHQTQIIGADGVRYNIFCPIRNPASTNYTTDCMTQVKTTDPSTGKIETEHLPGAVTPSNIDSNAYVGGSGSGGPSTSSPGTSTDTAPDASDEDTNLWGGNTEPETTCDGSGSSDPAHCLSDPSTKSGKIVAILKKGLTVLSGAVIISAVIMLITAGVQYSASNGEPNGVTAAKKKIGNVLLGLLAYVFLYAFLQWLIPGGIVIW